MNQHTVFLKIVCGLFAILIGFGYTSLASAQTRSELDHYYQSIRYDCNTDSDCAVKDIGNCCGYYPACVNNNAAVSRDAVTAACRKGGLISVCGFTAIQSCQCVEKHCVGKDTKAQP